MLPCAKGVKKSCVSATRGSNGPVYTAKSAASLHVTGSKEPNMWRIRVKRPYTALHSGNNTTKAKFVTGHRQRSKGNSTYLALD